MKKDVIYIEADDEIAVVADKLVASKSKVVALVLPKRCTMLHSSVNMKILNKAATNANKSIVLISTEQALLPIAGAAGMYVAKSLQSKPSVPELSSTIKDDKEDLTAPIPLDTQEPVIDTSKPVGELANVDSKDNKALAAVAVSSAATDNVINKKSKKKKKMSVPNFDSFRKKLFLGIGIFILVLGLLYLAIYVLPKSTVAITVDQNDIPVAVTVKAGPKVQTNIDEKTFELTTKTITKNESKQGPATGEKNKGAKASGKVTIYNCSKSDKLADTVRSVPAGTGVSSGGQTFITQSDVSVSPSGFNGDTCKFDKPSSTVVIIAQNPGESYNLSPRSYAVNGYASMSAQADTATSGGTNEIVKVVLASDCESLQNAINASSNADAAKQELATQLKQEGITPSIDTFKAETTNVTCEPAVGQESPTVTAKATLTYTMSGISTDSLNQLITKEALNKAGEGQTLISTGIENASLVRENQLSSGSVVNFNLKTTAVSGVKQDEQLIKSQIVGKNARETAETLKKINGVQDVIVSYSPFWVNKNPSNPSKITVKFIPKDEK